MHRSLNDLLNKDGQLVTQAEGTKAPLIGVKPGSGMVANFCAEFVGRLNESGVRNLVTSAIGEVLRIAGKVCRINGVVPDSSGVINMRGSEKISVVNDPLTNTITIVSTEDFTGVTPITFTNTADGIQMANYFTGHAGMMIFRGSLLLTAEKDFVHSDAGLLTFTEPGVAASELKGYLCGAVGTSYGMRIMYPKEIVAGPPTKYLFYEKDFKNSDVLMFRNGILQDLNVEYTKNDVEYSITNTDEVFSDTIMTFIAIGPNGAEACIEKLSRVTDITNKFLFTNVRATKENNRVFLNGTLMPKPMYVLNTTDMSVTFDEEIITDENSDVFMLLMYNNEEIKTINNIKCDDRQNLTIEQGQGIIIDSVASENKIIISVDPAFIGSGGTTPTYLNYPWHDQEFVITDINQVEFTLDYAYQSNSGILFYGAGFVAPRDYTVADGKLKLLNSINFTSGECLFFKYQGA